MTQPGFEPQAPRSKIRHHTTGLTRLLEKWVSKLIKVQKTYIFQYLQNLNFLYFLRFLIVLNVTETFSTLKAIQKIFFEGIPLVITP